MSIYASTQTTVKKDNQKMIIDLLRNSGPLSRARLSEMMHSSKPTVSKNVEELILEGKIVEIGKAENSKGKKGILLNLNFDYSYVLGIDMSKNKVKIALSNLNGDWINYKSTEISESIAIDKLVDDFFKDYQEYSPKVKEVIISFSGVVGHNDIYYINNIKQKEMLLNNLLPFIEGKFNVKPIIKNDINLATITEKRIGEFSENENLFLISCDVGVGSGIIINNQIFEGERKAAGEIGFLLPTRSKSTKYRTLEERICINAIIERYKLYAGKIVTIENFVKLLHSGEINAIEIYDEIIDDLAISIANIVSILDIRRVIVMGRVFLLKENMVETLNKKISEIAPFETIVDYSTIKDSSLKGAIFVGIDQVVEKIVLDV